MGLIVDTSRLILAERKDTTMLDLARSLKAETSEDHFGISVISLTELAVGQVQTKFPQFTADRKRFLASLQRNFTIYPVTPSAAIRAGILSGTMREQNAVVGLADLLIAATALDLNFGVLTHNVKDFARIPELRVIPASAGAV